MRGIVTLPKGDGATMTRFYDRMRIDRADVVARTILADTSGVKAIDFALSGPLRPSGFQVVGLLVVRLGESEASDAIADHDNSDHEQKHNHDCHIVLHQPLP